MESGGDASYPERMGGCWLRESAPQMSIVRKLRGSFKVAIYSGRTLK